MSSTTSTARTTLRQRFYDELVLLRGLGFDDSRDRLHQCRYLLHIAPATSNQETDAEKLADLIERAASRLGRVYGPTILTLFGSSETARGLTVAARHKLAHEVFCAAERAVAPHTTLRQITLSTFRTRTEKHILNDLITELFAIARGK